MTIKTTIIIMNSTLSKRRQFKESCRMKEKKQSSSTKTAKMIGNNSCFHMYECIVNKNCEHAIEQVNGWMETMWLRISK